MHQDAEIIFTLSHVRKYNLKLFIRVLISFLSIAAHAQVDDFAWLSRKSPEIRRFLSEF